jgi:hypothetical protein
MPQRITKLNSEERNGTSRLKRHNSSRLKRYKSALMVFLEFFFFLKAKQGKYLSYCCA